MATFVEDAVRLKLAGGEVPLAQSYEVNNGVIEVPCQFSMDVGHGGLFRELAAAYPPKTPFELFIRDVKVATGETDGIGIGGEATILKISGRDLLGRLQKTQILSDRTLTEKTYRELTLLALDECGLGDRELVSSNAANRAAITGGKLEKTLGSFPRTEDEVTDAGSRAIYRTVKASIGNTWLELLVAEFRRAGLFLWAAGDGSFVLSAPNGNQAPRARILRRRGQVNNEVTVLGQPSFEHSTVNRFSECIVVSRTGVGKNGRSKVDGRHIDEEMVAILNPDPANRDDGGVIREPLIVNDKLCKTIQQAELLARRRIAEGRRNAWKLSYRVAGHTTPALRGGGRVVWQPDIVVEVIDDELGIEGPMYLESVKFTGTPTVTELRLMRCEDLVFQEEIEAQPKHKLVEKKGVVPDPAKAPLIRVAAGLNIWNTAPNVN